MEILELKSTITKMKNSPKGLNSRFELVNLKIKNFRKLNTDPEKRGKPLNLST
jgi:hypothetical protein